MIYKKIFILRITLSVKTPHCKVTQEQRAPGHVSHLESKFTELMMATETVFPFLPPIVSLIKIISDITIMKDFMYILSKHILSLEHIMDHAFYFWSP